MNKKIWIVLSIAAGSLFYSGAALANPRIAVTEAVQQEWPGASVRKVAFSGRYALVGWNQNETGSIATLENTEQGWVVISDATRGWPPIEIFAKERGMTIEEAEELLDAYDPNWRQWSR